MLGIGFGFEVQIEPSANPADKGRAMAERIVSALLNLNGLESLENPPARLAGGLYHAALRRDRRAAI